MATRRSFGYVSRGTPTVREEYGTTGTGDGEEEELALLLATCGHRETEGLS